MADLAPKPVLAVDSLVKRFGGLTATDNVSLSQISFTGLVALGALAKTAPLGR